MAINSTDIVISYERKSIPSWVNAYQIGYPLLCQIVENSGRSAAADLRSTSEQKNKPERTAEMGPCDLGLPARTTNASSSAPAPSGAPERRRVINEELKVLTIAEEGRFFAFCTWALNFLSHTSFQR